MATYFGYAEKQADSYINWAAIGKSMSDTLAEEMRIREEKKAAIDNSSVGFGQELDKYPQGEHKGMNQWALEYANNAQQARLMQDKLLRSGQLNMKDYMVMRQNVVDGTSQAFDLMKEYQEEYKAKMDAYNKGESSEIEPWLMGEVEGFANFSESSLYINPTTGVVNVGKMVVGEDGVRRMSDNPNDFATVNSLRNRIKARYKKFDVQSNVGKYVSTLGNQIRTINDIKNKYQRGTITEILDPTQVGNLPADAQGIVKTFAQAENDMLQALIVNPNDASSVLLDAVDFVPGTSDAYTPTWSKEEAAADPSKILYQTDPKSGVPAPVLSEEQRQVAMGYLKTQARLMYDRVEKVQVVGASERPQQQQWQAQSARDTAARERLMKDWQMIRNGTEEEKKAALDAITGNPIMQGKGLMKLSIKDDKVLFEYSDPKFNKPVDITDDAESFFRSGTEAFGDYTDSELKKYGKGDRYYLGKELSSARQGEPAKPQSNVNRYQNFQSALATITPDDFKKTDNDLAKVLESALGGFGFTFKSNDGGAGNQYVSVTPPGGLTSFTIDANAYYSGEDDRNDFLQKISERINQENANSILPESSINYSDL